MTEINYTVNKKINNTININTIYEKQNKTDNFKFKTINTNNKKNFKNLNYRPNYD